jgi:hypothetical protein
LTFAAAALAVDQLESTTSGQPSPWLSINVRSEEPIMCRPVLCETCGKITWAGCGDHIEEVRAQVPPEDWCPGHESEQPRTVGWLRRLSSR